MPGSNSKLRAAVEDYFDELRKIRSSGVGTDERSYYPALTKLLDAVGNTLHPKVFCVSELAQQGAGHPDIGLFVERQGEQDQAVAGYMPDCGVVEVKPAHDDAWLTAESPQVSRYWERYRLVLVTNTRDFVLLGEDYQGGLTRLETFRLADSAADFEARLRNARVFANAVGSSLADYLVRVLSHRATIVEPDDLARMLAAYARIGLSRVEAAGDSAPLVNLRSALEEALGVQFEGEQGMAFFRSSLVQTLFYGVFSAWVIWARQNPSPGGRFSRSDTERLLQVPVLRQLFYQLAYSGRLQPLGLDEVLDWATAALNRVDREGFFNRFTNGEAVQYFYEPFLAAFDPVLRKQLGVWYTPVEVVRYMVARVDRALKDDLGIADGLAAENVYVLDPCCGTGAYLAETLRRIAANLDAKGPDALKGADLKRAATERVFGFEIMPAPYVVAHLQVGLTMQDLDAALSDQGSERAGVFLTNALTGWEPRPQIPLPFLEELERERDQAQRVKQHTPVLVILGNPPYNGRAGRAGRPGKAFEDSLIVKEERDLSEAYRTTSNVKEPQGQGLNDLYVRFFRMAERRITEMTGRGVVCFISNYSWLDGLSFTGMRERYLETFDSIRIDNLHGDRIISEYAPDGRTSETVFAIQGQSPGIRIGTAIVLLSKSGTNSGVSGNGRLLYRDFQNARAEERRNALLCSLDSDCIDSGYEEVQTQPEIGLPFKPMAVTQGWSDWPSLPALFSTSFSGVKTSRDSFLTDIDLDRLEKRVADYFNLDLGHEEIARLYPSVMNSSARYNPRAVRDSLLIRGEPHEKSGIVRYTYRPFDNRWLYWEAETKLLDEKRADYEPHVFEGNWWLEARQREAREDFSRGTFCRNLADNFGNGLSTFFPAWLRDEQPRLDGSGEQRRPNLSDEAQAYLDRLGLRVEELFHHALAVLHDPVYREANAGALRMEWPRIPLPGWPDEDAPGAADDLRASAARGRELAALLDPETPVPGVTAGTLRPELAAIAVPSTAAGGNMTSEDFALTAGWGHFGTGDAVMPGTGRAMERDYTASERESLGDAVDVLGDTTVDVHLNHNALWCNVPAAVWNYKLGGYQVLKKWLSYREHKALGRNLSGDEVRHFTDTARRIAAILILTSQ